MPLIMFTRVDLPAPDLPVTATNSPAAGLQRYVFQSLDAARRRMVAFIETGDIDTGFARLKVFHGKLRRLDSRLLRDEQVCF